MLFFLWLEFPASIRMLSFFNLQASLRVFTIIQLKVFIRHCSNSQHNTIEIALSKELGDLNSRPSFATNFAG